MFQGRIKTKDKVVQFKRQIRAQFLEPVEGEALQGNQ